MGAGYSLPEALLKGFLAGQINIPKAGCLILVTIRQREQKNFIPLAKRFYRLDCKFMATEGTGVVLAEQGIRVMPVKKISEGIPNILDIIRSGLIDLIIDIPSQGNDMASDGFKIRRTAAESGINVMTSLDTVEALLTIMESGLKTTDLDVIPIGQY
jgi:carbamoyl-phosphate synthase large subunit